MKKLITLIAFTFVGCASATTHDWCQARIEHYANYGECYAERSKEVEEHPTNFFKAFAKGYKESEERNKSQLNCTSTTIGGTTNTSCN